MNKNLELNDALTLMAFERRAYIRRARLMQYAGGLIGSAFAGLAFVLLLWAVVP